MNNVSSKEHKRVLPNVNTIQHTVLIAEAKKSAVQQQRGLLNNVPAASLHTHLSTFYSTNEQLTNNKVCHKAQATYAGAGEYILRVSSNTISRYVSSCEASYMDLFFGRKQIIFHNKVIMDNNCIIDIHIRIYITHR